MKSLVWTVPTALLMFFLIHGNDSLQCYSCTAQINSTDSCEMNVSQTMSEMCPENSTLCISVLFNDTITRKCAAENYSCNQEIGNTNCFECNKDFCNIDSFNNSTDTNINTTTIPPNYYTNTTTNITLSTTTAITPIGNTTNSATPTPAKGSATEVRSKVFPVIVFSIISILFKSVN